MSRTVRIRCPAGKFITLARITIFFDCYGAALMVFSVVGGCAYRIVCIGIIYQSVSRAVNAMQSTCIAVFYNFVPENRLPFRDKYARFSDKMVFNALSIITFPSAVLANRLSL